MKLKELAPVIFNDIIVYTTIDEEFVDLYKGDLRNVPSDILDTEVVSIGFSSKRNVLDIKIK